VVLFLPGGVLSVVDKWLRTAGTSRLFWQDSSSSGDRRAGGGV